MGRAVSKYIIQIYQIIRNNKYKNLVEGAQFGCAVSIALDNGGDAVGLAAKEDTIDKYLNISIFDAVTRYLNICSWPRYSIRIIMTDISIF